MDTRLNLIRLNNNMEKKISLIFKNIRYAEKIKNKNNLTQKLIIFFQISNRYDSSEFLANLIKYKIMILMKKFKMKILI